MSTVHETGDMQLLHRFPLSRVSQAILAQLHCTYDTELRITFPSQVLLLFCMDLQMTSD